MEFYVIYEISFLFGTIYSRQIDIFRYMSKWWPFDEYIVWNIKVV